MKWAVLIIYSTLAFMAVGALWHGRQHDNAAMCALMFAVFLGLGCLVANAPAFR
jgi:hypothetical protein